MEVRERARLANGRFGADTPVELTAVETVEESLGVLASSASVGRTTRRSLLARWKLSTQS
jgi:hypothetical protein